MSGLSGLSSLSSLHVDHGGRDADAGDVVAYDTEASDVDVWHGQILQFSAVRANLDLEEKEAHDIHVRLLPYVVPAPEAMSVTGLDVATLSAADRLHEYDAAKEIERILKPPYGGMRTFLTHNGLRFDDGIIRTTLFRNLRYPYVTSGKQVRRVDTLPLVQMVAAAQPDALAFEINQEGKRSYRLESLCRANGVAIRAHDGLEDTRGHLAIARMLRENAPWAWDIAMTNGSASAISRMLSTAWREKKAVWHFEHFGEPDLAPCAVLGTDDKGKWFLVDLRVGMDVDDVDVTDPKARSAAGIRVVRANSMPMILDHDTAARFGKVLGQAYVDDLTANLLATNHAELLARLGARGFDEDAGATSEHKLFDGFPSPGDKSRMEAFHRASDWSKRSEIVFEDSRLADFAARLVAMHAPRDDLFGPDPASPLGNAIARFQAILDRPFAGKEAPWQTLESCMEVADEAWLDWARSTWPDRVPSPSLKP